MLTLASYIGLPTDIAMLKTPAFNLQVPLEATLPPNNPALQSHVVEKIRGLLDSASKPMIIVDGGQVPLSCLLIVIYTDTYLTQEPFAIVL
jgi:TPP-dependent 2-oxoacid decarboxylase